MNIGKNRRKNEQFGKLNNLKSIDPEDLFNPQNNDNQSIVS